MNDRLSTLLREVRIQPRCKGAVGWVVDLVAAPLTATQPEAGETCELDAA